MGFRLWWILFLSLVLNEGFPKNVYGLACNWGTRSTHPLPPNIVVKLMKDNGFDKVKLFEPDSGALKALGHSGIQVMVGIPNEFLAPLASSVTVAENWVAQNISSYVSRYGTDVRYVAVGNEPFLQSYKDMFVRTLFPALKNIQAALIKAGLGKQVKVTVPLNADVYQSDNDLPSGGRFRPEVKDLVVSIIKFLSNNKAPITINIYPFLSLQADPNFPKEYAFFDGKSKPVVDGSISYTNTLDANFDTLIAALDKIGFSSIPIIIGEVGWPTDGDPNANIQSARRFNQGLISRILKGKGTPRRSTPPDTYIFSLTDEDAKSIDPGKFERHWGVFNFDGTIKYSLQMGSGKGLIPAKGVRYLAKEWCVMAPGASVSNPNLVPSLSYACTYADCTSLGNGSSCGMLDVKANASYAFNKYYQTMDQRKGSCNFNNLTVITTVDPSPRASGSGNNSCRFEIMIDLGKHERATSRSLAPGLGDNHFVMMSLLVVLLLSLLVVW